MSENSVEGQSNPTSIISRLSEALVARPLISAALVLVLLGVSFAAMPHFNAAPGMDVFLPDGTELADYTESVTEAFVSDSVIFVIYESDDIFSHRTLTTVRRLVEDLEEIGLPLPSGETFFPVEEINGLTTIRTPVGMQDGFETLPLVPDPVPTSQEALDAIERRARDNPMVRDGFLAKDEQRQAALFLIRLEAGVLDYGEAPVIDRMREVIAAVPTDGKVRFELFGQAVMNVDLVRYQNADLAQFMPMTLLAALFVLLVFVRRIRGMFNVLGMIIVAVVVGVATLPLTGGSLNNCTAMIPPLVIALTVAVAIHFLSELGKHAQASPGEDVRARTLRGVLPPSFMAAMTTSIGFAALMISDIPAIRQFGIAAAVAVMAVFAIATALSVLAWRRRTPEQLISKRGLALSPVFRNLLENVNLFVSRRRWPLVLVSLAVLVFLGAGISRISVDHDALGFFGEDTPLRRAHAFMEETMGGTTTLLVSIKTEDRNRFFEPEELGKLEALAEFMRQELGADAVTSMTGWIKLMNREVVSGAPEAYRIPNTKNQVAQLQLLNGDLRIFQYVTDDFSWVRVEGRTRAHTSATLARAFEMLDGYLEREFPAAAGYEARTVGRSRMAADLLTQLMDSQILSLSTSAVLIFILVFFLLGSLRAGVHSIIPNLFPVTATLGLMGWFGINLDAATVMISTVALGIGVDDTIHFLQYLRGRLRAHGDLDEGIRETMLMKGPAIIGTSITLTAGFAILAVSTFAGTRNFGVLISIAMVAAVLGDIFTLPAILLVTRATMGEKTALPTGSD